MNCELVVIPRLMRDSHKRILILSGDCGSNPQWHSIPNS